MGFLWPAISRIMTESTILSYKNTGQRKSLFSHTLGSERQKKFAFFSGIRSSEEISCKRLYSICPC